MAALKPLDQPQVTVNSGLLTIFSICFPLFYHILSTFVYSRKIMRLTTLFKLNKNKSYNYTPRYYNERKERLENLKKQKAAKPDQEYFKGYRRKSFREDWKTVKSMDRGRNSQLRFFVILIFLLIFAYAAIKYGKLDFLY